MYKNSSTNINNKNKGYRFSFLSIEGLLLLAALILLILLITSSFSYAAISPDDEITVQRADTDITQRTQQEREDDLRNREIQEIEKIRESREFKEDEELSERELKSRDKDVCIPLSNIIFKGNTVYSTRKLKRKFLKKHLGKDEDDNEKCITKSNLNTIQTEITNYYISKGYTNARVYFDASRLSTSEKLLIIYIAEGYIKNIELNNNSWIDKKLPFRKSTKKFTAFPMMKNKPFNLRDFEQGLDQMNRLASNNAKMESRPSTNGGYSDVIINNTITKPTTVNLSYDNSGQKSTGKYKRKISLSQDNLLALNDNFYINYISNNDGDSDDKYSKSFYTTFSVPLGYWTVSSYYSKSKYLTTVDGLNTSIKTKGSTATENYKIDRVIARGRKYKTKIGADLTRKDTETYINNEFIETSSRKLTIGSVFVDNTLYTKAGTFYIKPSYVEGLSIAGAKNDDGELSNTNPHAQYELVKLYGYYNKNFKTALPFSYNLSFDSQYSWDALYGSEQFSVGGQYTVRGFQENSISGDSGYNIRNDVTVNLADLSKLKIKNSELRINDGNNSKFLIFNSTFKKLLRQTDLKFFYDYGFVRNKYIEDGDETASGYMSGVGTGIDYSGKYLNWDLTYARGLHSPKYIENVYGNTPDEETIYFSIGMKFGV